jgi:uncharacterized membrane protein (UPF0182 family)
MLRWFWKRILPWILGLIGIWLTFDLVCWILAETLWFQEIGYPRAFWLRLSTRAILLSIVFGVSSTFLIGNLILANRLKYKNFSGAKYPEKYGVRPPQEIAPVDLKLRLRSLLPIVIGLAALVELMTLYYVNMAVTYWQPKGGLPLMYSSVPRGFGLKVISEMLGPINPQNLPGIFLFIVGGTLLLCYPRLLWAIAGILSLCFGFVVSNYWAKFLLLVKGQSFNVSEPLFNHDISFYIFQLPFWELLEFWLKSLFFLGFISVFLTYILSGKSLSEGEFVGFHGRQRGHLYGLSSLFMASISGSYWLSCYRLLYSPRGVTYGASFTDVNAQLPGYILLSFLAGAISLWLLGRTIFWFVTHPHLSGNSKQVTGLNPLAKISLKIYQKYQLPWSEKTARHQLKKSSLSSLRYGICVYVVVMFMAEYVWPNAMQRLIVQPNELQRETPYIERSIAFTRQGFGLDNIDVRTFEPEGKLTYEDIQKNDLTIRNIRLWDSRPLLQTNRQLQQIRLYYKFPDADIDRYTLKKESPSPQDPPTEKQQVLLAARELDYNAVPDEAKTWVNEHLIYTHGYGFTLSPVNTVGPGGLPDYFVKDIGVGSGDNQGMLGTSSERIRVSIPISHPRIYYGELTDTYVMAPSQVGELDYPSGDENVYNTYDGMGGVPINSWWRRVIFAQFLNNWQMMLTRNFTPETKVLFRRSIEERIKLLAPFLNYDSDPYLVVANTSLFNTQGKQPLPRGRKFANSKNYLYWMIDAYTTSDRYPYSDPGSEEFNYIRNSVKVVIDAYDGSINLYVADPSDPIIATWQNIFPGLFQPLDAIPLTLKVHIRYPEDLFSIQSKRLLTYHMTDPQVFYNREDQWQVPQEIYGNQQQPVEPYYLIMKLPTEDLEEFILLHPFTPSSRNNLIAWLAGRSDGDNYGKLLLYQFPKQQLIYGPEQIEARINQDPVISQQISLWTRQGSSAIQGNLLVIPIEQSLLYVEPLYLEAEENSLPILARVIVVYENRIVMAETLNQALQAVFQPENSTSPAIVRPVEQPALPLNEPILPLQ